MLIMTTESFFLIIACCGAAAVVLVALLPGKKAPDASLHSAESHWRTFRVSLDGFVGNDVAAIAEVPGGFELRAADHLRRGSSSLRLVDDQRAVRVRLRPAFLSFDRLLRVEIDRRERFRLRCHRGLLTIETPPRSAALEIRGDLTARDWELVRDGRTVATAYCHEHGRHETHEDEAECFFFDTVADEDPLPWLAALAGVEVLLEEQMNIKPQSRECRMTK